MVRLHSIESFGTHEGPGIRLVLFLQGCNLDCLYCHNPDTKPLTGGREFGPAELRDLISQQRPYWRNGGGVTISGGEPTLQAAGVIELFRCAKELGIHTALDTNGTVANRDVEELYGLTDLVLLDVKHIDPTWHRKLTGQDNRTALELARLREQSGRPFWIRYVLVPGWTDQPEHLHGLGRHFRDYGMVERLEILPYHTLGVQKYQRLGLPDPLAGVAPPTAEGIAAAQSILAKYFKTVIIR